MWQLDFNTPWTYFVSLLTLGLIFGFMAVLNKLLEDKLVEFLKSFYHKIKFHHDFNDSSMQETITNINSDLAVQRSEFHADRACIYEFHNGSEYTSKLPSWKITNTYERVRPGIPYGKEQINSMAATLLWDNFLEFIFKEVHNAGDENVNKDSIELPQGIYKLKDNLRCKGNGGCPFPRKVLKYIPAEMPFSMLKAILENQGVEVVFFTPIIDTNGHIIGIISIEYNDIEDFQEIAHTLNPCSLCNYANQVAFTWVNNGKALKK